MDNVIRNTSGTSLGSSRQKEPKLLENTDCGDENVTPTATFDEETSANPTFYESADHDVLIAALKANQADGLQTQFANERLLLEGPNELEKKKRPNFFMLFLAQLTNLIIILLILAAIASFAVNSIYTGVAIIVIVILNAGIAAATENSAGSALEALSKMSQPEVRVWREGVECVIPSREVVRGDILVLGVGDVVPADARLLESADFKVDEMPLTGESEDVSKRVNARKAPGAESTKLTPDDMIFSGCNVTNGSARAIVVAIGMKTRVGHIATLLTGDKKKKGACSGFLPDTSSNQTPLQASLQKLGVIIGVLAIFVCIAVFGIGLGLKTADPLSPETPGWVYMILISITLTVAAIPEGIPLCVTISLSSGCSDMVKRNVLVRRIAAVESLGSASVICSDKTGTLTEGKMTAVKAWTGASSIEISGIGFNPTEGGFTFTDGGANAGSCANVRSMFTTALMCSNASVSKETSEDGSQGVERWVPKGNSSEVPLVVAAGKIDIKPEDVGHQYPRLMEVPFSSSRKMMLTVCKGGENAKTLGQGGVALPTPVSTGGFKKGSPDVLPEAIVCVKGAPNYLLEACSTWVNSNGVVEPLTAEVKKKALDSVDDLSSQALRVLAIAVRPMAEVPFSVPPEGDEEEVPVDEKMGRLCQDLTLLGLVASMDPPRKGVLHAVRDCHGGHIRVVMITGDYVKTAEAIAREVGIFETGSAIEGAKGQMEAVDCTALRPGGVYLTDDELDELTKRVVVFARAKPEDKLVIVKSLQRQGLASAMTGDGVNDAPALKAADIGVAMGIQGTEVAKGASDMILTDDNFCSIVGAVEKGRVIYAGIQKFVAFIMSVHIAEVLQIFICIVCALPVMRSPIQILYLVLATDLAPSIALGLEPGMPGIMSEKPRPKTQPIVLSWMWQSMVANSVMLAGVILGVYYWALNWYCGSVSAAEVAELIKEDSANGLALQKAQTVAFISLVWSENIRAYTARSFDKPFFVSLFSNPTMQKAIGLAQTSLYLAIFLPGLSDVLGLKGLELDWQGWVAALIGATSTLLLCELYKPILTMQRRHGICVGKDGAFGLSSNSSRKLAKKGSNDPTASSTSRV